MPEDEIGNAEFGESVALSANGNTAVIGGESDSGGNGAAWVFVRNGSTWEQQGPRLIGGGAEEGCGSSVGISADGSTVLVGCANGFARTYSLVKGTWTVSGELLAAPAGLAAALSANGQTAITTGEEEVNFYAKSGGTWTHTGSLPVGRVARDGAALSADGTVAVAAGTTFHFNGSSWERVETLDEEEEVASVALDGAGTLAALGQYDGVQVYERSGLDPFAAGSLLTNGPEGYVAVSGNGAVALVAEAEANRVRFFENPPAPTVTLAAATQIGQTSAQLHGSVDPNGREVTSCVFEYGPSESYGHLAPCTTSPGSGEAAVPVSGPATGLEPGHTYHYRLRAENGAGATNSSDGQFTTATPSLPEVGRCLHLAKNTGHYRNAACTTESTGNTGAYEWQPWPAPGDDLSTATGATVTLETTAKVKIKCAASHLGGEFTGSQSALLSLVLNGCEAPGALGGKCSSAKEPAGEVAFEPLAAHLGVITVETKPKIGWSVRPATGETLASFTCGTTHLSLRGAAIAAVKSADSMTPSFSLDFARSGARQKPEHFASGPSETLTLASVAGEEQVGLTLGNYLTSTEALEIKSTP